jgi:hypothetical protein
MKEWMVWVLLAAVVLLALVPLRGPVHPPAPQLSFTIKAEKTKLLVGEPSENPNADRAMKLEHDLGAANSDSALDVLIPYSVTISSRWRARPFSLIPQGLRYGSLDRLAG